MKHFITQEIVSKEYFRLFGEKSLQFVDPRIIACAELFRDLCGQPVIANNWHRKGFYSESGLRDFNTKTGAPFSQHKYGRALDLKVIDWSAEQMHEVIFDNKHLFWAAGLTTVEHPDFTKGKYQDWLHIDCRFTGKNDIVIFKP